MRRRLHFGGRLERCVSVSCLAEVEADKRDIHSKNVDLSFFTPVLSRTGTLRSVADGCNSGPKLDPTFLAHRHQPRVLLVLLVHDQLL